MNFVLGVVGTVGFIAWTLFCFHAGRRKGRLEGASLATRYYLQTGVLKVVEMETPTKEEVN